MLSGLPASLIARRATCGLLAEQERIAELAQAAGSLQADLLGGKWRIDRPTFLLYSEDVEAYLAHAASNGASASAASALPEGGTAHSHALAMAEGLGLMWREWRGGRAAGTTIHGNGDDLGQTLLLMWKGTAETATGLIGSPDFLRAEILAPLDPLLRRQGAALAPGDDTGHALRARRAAADTSLPWDLTIVSADPAADRARSAGRRQLFLLIAGLLGVLVIAGTYFSSRAVARELEMARLQSDFVSAVSHDFRTPLTSLRQVTEALLSDRVPAHRRNDYYAVQRRGINRLHRLVEGLLDFGRMEAGAQEFEPQSLEVGSWIRSVVRDFGDEVDKHGYTIELGSDASGIEIDGDEPALTRALWNVLDNAVKYSPDCRTVWVECRSEAIATATKTHNIVIISIRDRGLGIDPAERDVIFGKFVRGSAAATSAASTGTGLGLAMVEHIVQAHGGQIEIDGALGKGTTFTIRLPARRTI